MSSGGMPQANGKAGGEQALVLVAGPVLGRALVVVPGLVIASAGHGAFWPVLAALPLLLLHLWLVLALARRFPSRSLFQYLPEIAGTWPARFLGAAFLLYMAVIPIIGTRYYGEVVSLYLLEMTPQPVIGILFLATAAAVAWLGLENMLRFFQILMFWGLLILVPLLFLAVPNFRWTFLQPFLPADWSSFWAGLVSALSTLSGAEMLLVFFPYFNRQQVVGRYAARGLILAHLLTLWATVGVLASFGPTTAGCYLFPSLEFIRAIHIPFTLLEQPSSIFSAFWVVAVLQIVSAYLLAMALGIKQLLGLKNYRSALLVLLVASFIVTQLWPTPQSMLDFPSRSATWRLAMMWGLPLLFYLLALRHDRKAAAR